MSELDLQVVKEMLPPRIRRWMYVVIALSSILLSAILVGFASSSYGVPEWLTIALAVVGSLAGPFGFLAANNTVVISGEVSQTLPPTGDDAD